MKHRVIVVNKYHGTQAWFLSEFTGWEARAELESAALEGRDPKARMTMRRLYHKLCPNRDPDTQCPCGGAHRVKGEED